MHRVRKWLALLAGAFAAGLGFPSAAATVALSGQVAGSVGLFVNAAPGSAVLGPGIDWSFNIANGQPLVYTAGIDLTETSLAIDLSTNNVNVIAQSGYRFVFSGLGISASTLDLNTTGTGVSLSIVDADTFSVTIANLSIGSTAREQVRFSLTPASDVPEPATMTLAAAALLAAAATRRRKLPEPLHA